MTSQAIFLILPSDFGVVGLAQFKFYMQDDKGNENNKLLRMMRMSAASPPTNVLNDTTVIVARTLTPKHKTSHRTVWKNNLH